jgi:hypothetical protein
MGERHRGERHEVRREDPPESYAQPGPGWCHNEIIRLAATGTSGTLRSRRQLLDVDADRGVRGVLDAQPRLRAGETATNVRSGMR